MKIWPWSEERLKMEKDKELDLSSKTKKELEEIIKKQKDEYNKLSEIYENSCSKCESLQFRLDIAEDNKLQLQGAVKVLKELINSLYSK